MIHLITYSNHVYENSKHRLCEQAKNTEWFDTIKSYSPEDLDSDYTEHFKNILNMPRGAGYWIWKSYIIKKRLEEIDDGDILIYLDSGCYINFKGEKRFDEYIKMLNNSDEGIISFQLIGHNEKEWTTKEIFSYFMLDNNGEIANSGQIIGGIRIMKKNQNIMKLINAETKVYYDNPLLVTDHYNNNQESYFKDNRHEQSIFSIIRKMSNPILLTDETFCLPFGDKESLKYPFWAARIR